MFATFVATARRHKKLLLVWAFAFVVALAAAFSLAIYLSISNPQIISSPSKKYKTTSSIVLYILVVPIFENIILCMGLWFAGLFKGHKIRSSAIAGIITGMLHYLGNGLINGIYTTVFFYIMAYIYLQCLEESRGWHGFWFTTGMHVINNFIALAPMALVLLFS